MVGGMKVDGQFKLNGIEQNCTQYTESGQTDHPVKQTTQFHYLVQFQYFRQPILVIQFQYTLTDRDLTCLC